MGALTHESLVEYLLEEAYEVAETIESGADDAELRGELGDVLLQVVLHARLAEERGVFGFDDVARGLTEKMIRRNPHVFRPDGSLQDSFPATVQEIVLSGTRSKRPKSPERSTPSRASRSLCPHWPRPRNPWTGPNGPGCQRRARDNPPDEAPAVELAETIETEAELGELLLAVVRSARNKGFDAERALRGAVRRYQNRQPESSASPDHDVRVLDRFP